MPGTDTMFRFGGYAKLDYIQDFRNAGNPDFFAPSSIPVTPTAGTSSSNLHVRQTRLSFDLRRPASDGSPVRVYFEADLFGANATQFRMRHAYAQYKNLLAGWSWSTFVDIDSIPDSLDFAGPNSMSLVRQAQVRYTQKLGRGHSIAYGVERALTDADIDLGSLSLTPTANLPDFALRWRYDGEERHLQFGAIFRSVGGYVTDLAEDHVFGYGLSLSGGFRTWGRDSVAFQLNGGRGIGRYLNDLGGQFADVSLENRAGLHTLPALAGFTTYQHYWSPRWRSSIVYGQTRLFNSSFQTGDAFHSSIYTLGNLIWLPRRNVQLGGEFLYGLHQVKDGRRGSAGRAQFSVQYFFAR
jgi:hypothetical protein